MISSFINPTAKIYLDKASIAEFLMFRITNIKIKETDVSNSSYRSLK